MAYLTPFLSKITGKCPKADEISEIEGVGGWVHGFVSIVPNLPFFPLTIWDFKRSRGFIHFHFQGVRWGGKRENCP